MKNFFVTIILIFSLLFVVSLASARGHGRHGHHHGYHESFSENFHMYSRDIVRNVCDIHSVTSALGSLFFPPQINIVQPSCTVIGQPPCCYSREYYVNGRRYFEIHDGCGRVFHLPAYGPHCVPRDYYYRR